MLDSTCVKCWLMRLKLWLLQKLKARKRHHSGCAEARFRGLTSFGDGVLLRHEVHPLQFHRAADMAEQTSTTHNYVISRDGNRIRLQMGSLNVTGNTVWDAFRALATRGESLSEAEQRR